MSGVGHWIIAPVLLPLVAGFVALVLPLSGSPRGAALQRAVSVAATLALLGVAVALAASASDGGHAVYRLGNWPAPMAIVLVLDRLSALMVLLTAVVAVPVLLHVLRTGHRVDDPDGREPGAGSYFHPLFQLQLAGLNCAFLTGDLFNLFVAFEILLIASYCLLVLGATAPRVRSALHYVLLNLIGSALFLIAVGALYGVTGTLNMAHMGERLAVLGEGDAALARAASLLLVLVFALKAAIVPLHFWLPNAYASAAAPVAALFALLTKVGVYSIIRFSTVVLGPSAGAGAMAGLVEPWLLPAALVTIVLGTVGAYGASELRRLHSYLLIASVGVMLAAVGTFTAQGIGAALYYLIHSTVVTAALFLLADAMVTPRGQAGGALVPAAPVWRPATTGVLFVAGAIGIAGMPPLSGFLGKALILTALPAGPLGEAAWIIILVSSLACIAALARAGSVIFWGPHTGTTESGGGSRPPLSPTVLLVAVLLVLTAAAGPVANYTYAVAEELVTDRAASYSDAVLRPQGGMPR